MKSVILLSGGLDSSVLLAHIRNTIGGYIHAISVDYGQRHRRELWSAFQIARFYGATHEVITLPSMLMFGSSLTGNPGKMEGVPTIIPGRNLILLSLATAAASRFGANTVHVACNADDRVVYPDCRAEFLADVSKVTQFAYGISVEFLFVSLSKREIVSLGRSLRVPFDMTWSCYDPQNQESSKPASGVPCGKCGACILRAESLS